MSLEIEGHGVAAVIKCQDGTILVFKDKRAENGDKKESLTWAKNNALISVFGLYQGPGGVVKVGESFEQAMSREIKEETDIEPDLNDIRFMDVSTLIAHERPKEGLKNYAVTLFIWSISNEIRTSLEAGGAVDIKNVLGEVRERDRIAYTLYAEKEGLIINRDQMGGVQRELYAE